jgi:hypothetical protein
VGDELDFEAPFTEQEGLLHLAVTVWNLQILNHTSGRSIRDKVATKVMTGILRARHPRLFDMLLARKQRDYPNDRRIIRKIDVSEELGHLFVNVAGHDFDNPDDR